MSTRYKGSIMSATAATASSGSAVGIWRSNEVMQAITSSWPRTIVLVDYLVVGGGGGGGGAVANAGSGGGGGAGGLLTSTGLFVFKLSSNDSFKSFKLSIFIKGCVRSSLEFSNINAEYKFSNLIC